MSTEFDATKAYSIARCFHTIGSPTYDDATERACRALAIEDMAKRIPQEHRARVTWDEPRASAGGWRVLVGHWKPETAA